MTYKLEQFGNTFLPNFNPQNDVGTGRSKLSLVDLPGGGVFDALGSERAPAWRVDIEKRCTFYYEDAEDLKDAFHGLRALRGMRDRLYRRNLATDEIEWCWARLTEMAGVRRSGDTYTLEVMLRFVKVSPAWYGANHYVWTFDAGYYFDTGLYFDSADFEFTLDTSPKWVTVTNGGNTRVTNVVITVTAGSAAITNLNVKRKIGSVVYEYLVYAGTITAGQSLVIDCGAFSVENNGADDYANFSLGVDHQTDDWFRLEAEDNEVEVIITGGSTNSKIRFEFYDGWE